MDKKKKEKNSSFDPLLKRAKEIQSQGLDWRQAWGKAWIEHKIKNWPSSWGDDLVILIYGDFQKPPSDIFEIAELGITVFPEKLENTVIRNALCVLKAKVKISQKTPEEIINAARRINILLGAWTLVEWGNGHIGWWSYMTHENGGGVVTAFDHKDLKTTLQSVLKLSPKIRKKIDAALYWIRSPKNLLKEFYRNDLFRIYAAYWNAFECLVDVICILRPQVKTTKKDKEEAINKYFRNVQGECHLSDIEYCYQNYVNPGFVGKASHALNVCFGDAGKHYIKECFKKTPKKDRLYDIRNAINHGDIDAENEEELLRIDSRLSKLFLMIWGIFGRIIAFSYPLDSDLRYKNNKDAN